MPKIQIKNIDDENVEILVNGICICYADHDEDGWYGMEKLENLAKDIAKQLNVDFERI